MKEQGKKKGKVKKRNYEQFNEFSDLSKSTQSPKLPRSKNLTRNRVQGKRRKIENENQKKVKEVTVQGLGGNSSAAK